MKYIDEQHLLRIPALLAPSLPLAELRAGSRLQQTSTTIAKTLNTTVDHFSKKHAVY